ncbi:MULTISPECIES: PocR ligand-binding domain-containing protein [Romboutsia]|uniref:Transcriptional regulator, AraC n=1 Tax=Romboutsia hominis TaxID=1507512 RepID=A0A2P2BQI1_9FIRM|nr:MULTISPECIES: PocR ligand-binding domain-containing protein [Romboutsia]MCH1959937.1 PocR ligand-binding domain-containing protein [Romboutsia hominis]MDB8792656.1 PocR ligand-binding domain-containing protein [Romboutsia sp. 1001216sp1]MDB8796177.1 PocR ligand-binding domain-containing protein [Romboutsia sp. 1001216sp1]MDB8798170.1 PocR ligand-binding domain-containing protein [Romboutsia sp. 1001216sp1]MDB8803579.1 PocR ligand-binding domain-containing protein [Romboutsia sp. 1001216sp1]
MNNTLSLEKIINIESFQKIQDDIAQATGIAIIMVNYEGKAITNHSNCTKFCSMIRKIDRYSAICEKCDSRGGLESVRMKNSYIYICHKGLVDFAAPIIVKDQYLGAVMAGQVLLEDNENIELEEIVRVNKDFDNLGEDLKKELEKEYKNLPVVSITKIKAIAQMMFHISNYIVEEAILKMSLNEASHKLKEENKKNQLEEVNIEIEEENIDENVNLKINEENEIKSPIIQAIEYIDNNINENITLDKISLVCNLSQCYFSKLFKKETGLNFINYLNSKKISKAKELLVSTDEPINNIAINLGFEDCGYFIRVFKKSENITPKKYRDLHIKNSSI